MMIERKSFHRYAMVIAAGLFMAGCSAWSYSPPLRGNYPTASMNVAALQAAKPAPGVSPFNQDLGTHYGRLSHSLLNNEGMMDDADYFARKGLAADMGKVVPPENVGNWAIATPNDAPVGYGVVLNDTRHRLVGFLDANRDRNADTAAHAQVLFDCWIEHTEWQIAYGFNGRCHAELMAILGGSQQTFVVYFNFNKSDLTADGQKVVDNAATYYKANGMLKVAIAGYTDTSGTAAYNMGLSHSRAETVRTAMIKDGVPAAKISAAWYGKTNLAVPTPDGVKEPRNRRTTISIQ
jgi:OOP family OmpA-OmpF porin